MVSINNSLWRSFGMAASESGVVQEAFINLGETYRRGRNSADRSAGADPGEEARRRCCQWRNETAHPGYLSSQDTFYVGTIKGAGRIYQHTFVDTYSKWAAAKLYTTKTPITTAPEQLHLNQSIAPLPICIPVYTMFS